MSGPVGTEDTTAATIEITPSREADVGGARVRRALPRRGRRTVGAWCFADHMGPGAGVDIGPHPHIGLQTVTWLVEGEILHRDSLGSEQSIRPGQLNLMTAGRGVSHSEETIGSGTVHGIQLWVAQTDATRHGDPAFEHRASLPRREIGDGVATVLVDEPGHVGLDLDLRPGRSTIELDATCEHALVVLDGAVRVCDGIVVEPGVLAFLGLGRTSLEVEGPGRAVLLGGTPFPEELVMWWNFVGRTRDEVAAAGEEWNAHHERFGSVASPIDRIPAPTPPLEDHMSDRFTITEDGHEAELVYRIDGDKIVLVHTGVPEELGGRGIGGKLVEQAIAKAKAEGLTIVAQCPFAKGWIEKHPEALDGVAVA